MAYFEDQLGMEVSSSKSCVTSSIPALARMAQTLVHKDKVRALDYRRGEVAKMLGVGTNGGVSRVIKTQGKRRKAVAGKTSHYQYLGRCGFSKKALTKATVMPAASYGCEVVGYGSSPTSPRSSQDSGYQHCWGTHVR